MRAVAVLAVAIGAVSTAVAAAASTDAPTVNVATPAAPGSAATSAPAKPGFFEEYRGHHIMGWGSGEKACAYIDGVRLVLIPGPDGTYSSAILAYQPGKSVRAITKASVKALGTQKVAPPTDPAPHCPTFAAPKSSE